MKKIILAAIAAIALTGCEDAREIRQPSEFDFAAAFQIPQDIKDGVFNIYGSANIQSHIIFASEFTDEGAIGEAGGNGSNAERLILNINDGNVNGIWSGYIGTIRNANILFEGARNIEIEEDDEDGQNLVNEALGENHALRAFATIQLMAHFTPDLNDPASLSVPVFDFIPELEYAPERNTLAEVVAFINNDLDEAERLLDAAEVDYSEIFISVQAVQAMRARLNAYISNYTEAVDSANDVLSVLNLPATADEDSLGMSGKIMVIQTR